MAERCITHRPSDDGTYCLDCNWGLIGAFYADPVDEHGNVIGTAHFEITHSTWSDPVAIKVPFSELGIAADTPAIRVREQDFPRRPGWWARFRSAFRRERA